MPDLRHEIDQLRLADEHIAVARRDVERMESVLARQRESGTDVEVSEAALAAVKDGLQVFLEHRRLIAETIDDLRAGRLPRS